MLSLDIGCHINKVYVGYWIKLMSHMVMVELNQDIVGGG